MDFADILAQWEAQTQRPYGKKRLRKKEKREAAYRAENTKTVHPIDYWIHRYGVHDKDADMCEEKSFLDKQAEKKRLRTMRPQAEIDLHGMTLEQASDALLTFFEYAIRKDYQKILIIHGKGNHSKGEPILARFVQIFLETHAHAGETGHPKGRDGGTGSTWVLLK